MYLVSSKRRSLLIDTLSRHVQFQFSSSLRNVFLRVDSVTIASTIDSNYLDASPKMDVRNLLDPLPYHMPRSSTMPDLGNLLNPIMSSLPVSTWTAAKVSTSTAAPFFTTFANRFACDRCVFRFSLMGNLNKHIKSVHEKKRPHLCRVYTFPFAFSDAFLQHMNLVHSGRRNYRCAHCSASFRQRSHLAKHVSCVHNEVKQQ